MSQHRHHHHHFFYMLRMNGHHRTCIIFGLHFYDHDSIVIFIDVSLSKAQAAAMAAEVENIQEHANDAPERVLALIRNSSVAHSEIVQDIARAAIVASVCLNPS